MDQDDSLGLPIALPVKRSAIQFGALALLSGFCALGYEVLYVRHLTTLLGDMLYVHAALLSTFLIGVALGAKLAHRAHRWLGAIEIGTGLLAVLIPFLTGPLSRSSALIQLTGSPVATVIVTALLMIGPSVLIGFSLPLFSAYAKTRLGDGPAFGAIYTVYNLGAFLGILSTEMLLIRWVGITASLAVLGGVNVAIGVTLLGAGSTKLRRPVDPARRFGARVLLAVAIAGIASAVWQMAFLKLVFLLFGPHRENFAVGLAVVLLGIGLGAAAGSRSRVRFGTALLAVPVFLAMTFLAHPRLIALYHSWEPLVQGSAFGIDALRIAFAAAYALPVMICYGAILPALMRAERAVAEESGQLLWVSGLANASGYLLYVGVFHPNLPMFGVLICVSVLCVVAALVHAGAHHRRLDTGLLVLASALFVALVPRWSERELYGGLDAQRLGSDAPFEVFRYGGESVALFGGGTSDEWISYNGHPSIWIRSGGEINYAEAVSGMIPALAAPTRDRALVLGLGTGITAGATATLFSQTDVVEINRAFLNLLRHIPDANLNIESNPAARIHVSDARAFLNRVDEPYDAIINSIPAPTYFSASKIYTREFYARVRGALKPDGVFSTWLSVTEMTSDGLDVVLAALAEAFPYCDLRIMREDYYMATCGAAPLDVRSLSELDAPDALHEILAAGLPALDLDWYFEDARLTSDLFAGTRPEVPRTNTDDFPILEFLLAGGESGHEGVAQAFVERWSEFGIDPTAGEAAESPVRLAHRAEVYRRLSRSAYRSHFQARVQADSAVAAAIRGFRP